MTGRRAISKRLRFEIFKRDDFTCVYCGARAAGGDGLHVDHLTPVASGGKNEPDNLVTACAACNLGKGAVHLDAVNFAELSSRNLMSRQARLKTAIQVSRQVTEAQIEIWDCVEHQLRLTFGKSHGLSDRQASLVLDAVERYGMEKVVAFLREPPHKYKSADDVLSALPKVLYVQNASQHSKTAYYVRGILRNRLQYVNNRSALMLCDEILSAFPSEHYLIANLPTDQWLISLAKRVDSWTSFRDKLAALLEKQGETA